MKKFILCLLSLILVLGCKKDEAKDEAVSIKKNSKFRLRTF